MGGAVSVTVRKEDGTVIPMCRWTNPLPYWLCSKDFIQNPTKHMDKYIEYGLTSSYNVNPLVAPEGYGLKYSDIITLP